MFLETQKRISQIITTEISTVKGKVIRLDDFQSTSNVFLKKVNIKFVNSKAGTYIGRYSDHPSEEEVIIGPGRSFKVIDIETRGGYIWFVMEEV